MTDLLIPTSSYRELTIEEILRRKSAIDEAAARAGHAQNNTAPVRKIIEGMTCRYGDIDIEVDIPREPNHAKSPYTFDDSLDRLQKRGFKRHLRAREAMGVIRDRLDGKLTGGSYELATSIEWGRSEWLDLVFLRERDTLYCYEGVTNLVFDDRPSEMKYTVLGNSLQFDEKHVFDVAGISSSSAVAAEHMPGPLTEYLYGAPYLKLPFSMRHSLQGASVSIPAHGMLRPASRLDFRIFDGVDSVGSRGCIYAKTDGLRSGRSDS